MIASEIGDSKTWCAFSQVSTVSYNITKKLLCKCQNYHYVSRHHVEYYKLPNGVLHGSYQVWDEDNNLLLLEYFYNGRPYGDTKQWYPNGKLRLWSEKKGYVQHGLRRTWNVDNILIGSSMYQNNKRHGLTETWHGNGRKAERTNYRNGIRHGPSQMWYNNYNNSLACSKYYCNGKLHGPVIIWYENGQKKMTTEYDNGKCGTLV